MLSSGRVAGGRVVKQSIRRCVQLQASVDRVSGSSLSSWRRSNSTINSLSSTAGALSGNNSGVNQSQIHYFDNSTNTNTTIRTNTTRTYTSRAHPKSTPTYHIFTAVDKVLEAAEKRCQIRQAKWDEPRSAAQRKKQFEAKPDNAGKPYPEETPYRNQDETFELVVGFNLDPRKANQTLRGSLPLKHGSGGAPVKVAVFTLNESEAAAALEAGATYAGGEELIAQIKSGVVPVTSIDRAVATSDMPAKMSQIGRLLGPRGLMPNPKMGTLIPVGESLTAAVQRQLAGLLQYRLDKYGNLHAALGKVSFGSTKVRDHIQAVMNEVWDKKPEGAPKGKYLLRCHVSSTQGGSYKIDLATVDPGSPYYMIPPASEEEDEEQDGGEAVAA